MHSTFTFSPESMPLCDWAINDALIELVPWRLTSLLWSLYIFSCSSMYEVRLLFGGQSIDGMKPRSPYSAVPMQGISRIIIVKSFQVPTQTMRFTPWHSSSSWLRLSSWNPLWTDTDPVDITCWCQDNWSMASVVNHYLVTDPVIHPLGFDLPWRQ